MLIFSVWIYRFIRAYSMFFVFGDFLIKYSLFFVCLPFLELLELVMVLVSNVCSYDFF